MDGYNAAMKDWRIDDADRYASLAARLYPDSETSKGMTREIRWIRDHPSGEWVEMVDSTGRNPEYYWIGPPGTKPLTPAPPPTPRPTSSRRFWY